MGFLAGLFRRPQRAAAKSQLRRAASPKADPRFRAVSIRPGEGCCEAARQFGKLRFLSAKAPRLPVPECTAAACHCRYVHFADRRSGRDRRARYDWVRERELGVVNRRSSRGRRESDSVA